MPDMPISLRIFRPGSHTTAAGQTIEFTAEHLAEIVASYDPQVHQAPLVKGHPKNDDPAYGWVDGLKVGEDGMLHAEFSAVDTGVKDEVGKGRYRHVSAALFRPADRHNPTPGKWSLRHVGLLGAAPPAVSGLGRVTFAADAGEFVEFAMGEEKPIARLGRQLSYMGHRFAELLRRQRDRKIDSDGLEAADKDFPDYEVTSLATLATEIRASADALDGSPVAYSAGADPDPITDEEETAVSDADKQELERLRAQLADRDKADADRARQAVHATHVEFCQGLVKEARLPQGDADRVVEILDHLAAHPGEEPVQFSIGDDKHTDAAGALKELLGRAKPAVTFGQVAGDEHEPAPVTFSMPNDGGMQVDPAGMELHQKATAYAAANNVPYADAVMAVGGN